MRTALASIVAALFAAAASPALAVNWADNRDPLTADPQFGRSKAICRSLKSVVAFPRPVPSGRPLPKPGSEALYYGIGVPADPAAAFQAAVRERSANDADLFSGDVMLMTMYANGIGAPRDLDRAIVIACNLDAAPSEEDGRVNHLATLKAQQWQGHDFSFCDDITSGYAQGFCAKHDAAIAAAARQQRFSAIMAGWSEADRRAFQPLQRAETAFAEARVGNEVDLSGTARGAMAVDEQESQQAEFLDMLQGLEKGTAPAATSAQADAADAKLNEVYQRIQHAANVSAWGTVTKDGIRNSQRAWLRYRDAWLAFARVRYPATTPDSLRAALTDKRNAALEPFVQ